MTKPAVRNASPREVALRILAWRYPGLTVEAAPDAEAVFDLAQFQADAVRRATEILTARRGVVVADSVGLGKTFVALGLIERTLRQGGRVAVTAPAALRRDWTAPLRRLAREVGVLPTWGLARGRGRPGRAHTTPERERTEADYAHAAPERERTESDDAHAARDRERTEADDAHAAPERDFAGPDRRRSALGRAPAGVELASGRAADAPFLGWVSHARLSRGTYPAERLAGLDLVVVDEAHAFRSPHTRRYQALAQLCRSARVVLLTATPVNNSASDLYHLLRLFAADGDFRDVGIPDLREAFRRVEAGPEGRPAPPSLLPLLSAVVIRRTRPFLREHYRGVRVGPGTAPALRELPRRAPPIPLRYDLNTVRPGFFDEIAEALTAFTLAAFRVIEYTERDAHAPARVRTATGQAELIRLTLLKRLESSLAALRASVVRQLRFHEAFLDSLARGRLLSANEHRALHSMSGDGDVAQLILHEVTLGPLPPGVDVNRLRADAAADTARLRQLQRELDAIPTGRDPKLTRLTELLEGELDGRKVVVFTEFRDTARFLWRALSSRRGIGLVDGAGAFLGRTPCGRRGVIDRFAPRANAVAEPSSRERVDVLIATDVLAEGLNLQDAGCVASYDLPWNPVRLIQRVGRIDRLGSPHTVIRSYHFLPDGGLDGPLGLLGRLRTKLAAIGRTIGAEVAVLDAGEQLARDFNALVDRLAAGDPDALDAIERSDAAPFELEERLRAEYIAMQGRMRESSASEAEQEHADTAPGRDQCVRPIAPAPAASADCAATERKAEAADRSDTQPDAAAADCRAAPRPDTSVDRAAVRSFAIGGVSSAETAKGGSPSAAAAQATRIWTGAVRAPQGIAHQVLIARAAGRHLSLLVGTPHTDAFAADDAAAARILLHALRAPPVDALPITPAVLEDALARVEAALASDRAIAGAPDPIRANTPAARAARVLLRALARVPGGPSPALCSRADAVFRVLTHRPDAGTEAAVRLALGGHGRIAEQATIAESQATKLISVLENAIEQSPRPRASATTPEDTGELRPVQGHGQPRARPRFLAVLEVRPR